MEEQDYYVIFPNVNEGLKLEKQLKEKKIKYTIVPTPREISKCCGICIKYLFEDEGAVKQAAAEHGIQVSGFHALHKRKK